MADGTQPTFARFRDQASFRTLFDTRHAYDAGAAGLDGPEAELGEAGGFSVNFDGRSSVPALILNGLDGEVQVCGLQAIEQLLDAVLKGASMARRMAGVA